MRALPLTVEELDAIRASLASRTPGKWHRVIFRNGSYGVEDEHDEHIARTAFVTDAEFIAAAPDAIDRLLAEVDAYRAKEKEAADKAAEFERSREQRYTRLALQLKGSDIEKDNDYLANWARGNIAKAIHKTFGTSGDLPPSDNERHEVIE